jgi:hypothetical protein
MSIADALAKNKQLKRLYIDLNHGITSNGVAASTHLMCNTSSVLSTYHSNHTLGTLGYDEKLPEDV